MTHQHPGVRFSDIETAVPTTPGLYQIITDVGEPLKVGISVNLRKRLIQHRQSKQSRLKLREGGNWRNPADVISKQSILAKHLYFSPPVLGYDLQTEIGRQRYLEERCHVLITLTKTREEARDLERPKEKSGDYRFGGRVKALSLD